MLMRVGTLLKKVGSFQVIAIESVRGGLATLTTWTFDGHRVE